MQGMAADGMDASFMTIFGEFLEGYSKCAKLAGTTPERFQDSIGTLIKVRGYGQVLSQTMSMSWYFFHWMMDSYSATLGRRVAYSCVRSRTSTISNFCVGRIEITYGYPVRVEIVLNGARLNVCGRSV